MTCKILIGHSLEFPKGGCFWLFDPKFWEVVGTNEWYFVIL